MQMSGPTESNSPEQQRLSMDSENSAEDQSPTKEVDRENTHLVSENQKLLAELDAGRKRERELIEHLVSAQMRVDKLQAIRLAQKKTIADLKCGLLVDRDGKVSTPATNKTLATSIRIRELEREVDYLTAHVEELSAKSQSKTIAWKYIEAQQDSLKTREELSKTRALVEDLNDQISQLRASNNQIKREANLAQTELAATRRAHKEHAKKTREQVNRLMKQICAERRKAVHETREEIKQLDQADSTERQQALEELRSEVGWLKYLSAVLQETCDALKLEHEQVKQAETDLVRTKTELRHAQRELAALRIRVNAGKTQSTDGQGEGQPTESVKYRNREEHKPYDSSQQDLLLELKMENYNLHKLIQVLRTRLGRKDPSYLSHYQFISGV